MREMGMQNTHNNKRRYCLIFQSFYLLGGDKLLFIFFILFWERILNLVLLKLLFRSDYKLFQISFENRVSLLRPIQSIKLFKTFNPTLFITLEFNFTILPVPNGG